MVKCQLKSSSVSQQETLLEEGIPVKEICEKLHRSSNCIYTEIRRGTIELIASDYTTYKKYCADVGERVQEERSHKKGVKWKCENHPEILDFIYDKIKNEKYSPSAVLMLIKSAELKFDVDICYSTVYNYIRNKRIKNLTYKDLPYALKPKKTKNPHKRNAHNHKTGLTIEERPDNILDRDQYGHWEMDTLVGGKGKSKQCLLVLTERKSRNEIVRRLYDKTPKSVKKVLDKIEHAIGYRYFKDVFKTITVDNGVEFLTTDCITKSDISKNERTTVYYCHPYCPSERGSNENQNKPLRRWFSKGCDFKEYSDFYIRKVQDWLNNYPRKLFGGLSSNQIHKLIEPL